MPFEIVTIPCLSDNYAFLLHADGGETVLVDAPEAALILAVLDQRGWSLDEVWITHHHSDHVDGLPELREAHAPRVTGAAADAQRLPRLDRQVADADVFTFAGTEVHVIDVSGHTVGHIAFHVPEARAAFTGDSLMALGCGRLFEGSARQMWDSLTRLAALPDDTVICSGHEYTTANARFALSVEPENQALKARRAEIEEARAAGRPTVPSRLDVEKATNPFLRAGLPEVKSAIDMKGAADAEVFAEIRRRKDAF